MQDRTVTLYTEMRAAWRAAGVITGEDVYFFEARHAALSREFQTATPTTPRGVAAKIREALRMRDAWRFLGMKVARKASLTALRFARDEHTADDVAALEALRTYADMVCAEHPETAEGLGVDHIAETLASALEGLHPRVPH
jgi:hypothetical protein